jgi:putative GTP pyrophosphokinase
LLVVFPKPEFSKGEVNKAGDILRRQGPELPEADDWVWAYEVLSNWRASHNYPINTFQATLRDRLRSVDAEATVAQRLKRFPSILLKLRRFENMQLARMQDIGGLRAIVDSLAKVRKIEAKYRSENPAFHHELVSSKDYIATPKPDGYRSVHLVYRYKNDATPDYNGLQLELQIRSRMQHAWATAVETMGTFLGQALKSGQGEAQWRSFFADSGAAIAVLEGCPPVPGYEKLSDIETFKKVAEAEERLHVLDRLRGFSVAANNITREKGPGTYHLIILDSTKRTVTLTPYTSSQLDEATRDYAKVEKRTHAGEQLEAVLVAAGRVEALKKAYPNYFLDTHGFIEQIEKVIRRSKPASQVRRNMQRMRVRRLAKKK